MVDIAWAAGIFEGEGCILIDPRTRNVRLDYTSTDLDVVERFKSALGIKHPIREVPKQKPHHKQAWSLRFGKKADVSKTLESFLPFFGDRRAHKALDALDHIEI